VTEPDPKTSPARPLGGAGAGPPGGADEFSHIPTPRRRPPFVALGAVILAAFLGWRLRRDVAFALSSSTPTDVGEAGELARAPRASVPWNRLARLSGFPERESAVILDTQGSWEFSQLFRLHGTEGRVLVRRRADPLPAELVERDRFTGRLQRFSDLSYGDSIRRHFATRVTATHVFEPAALARALSGGAAGPVALVDIAGARVTLAAGDELTIDRLRPSEIRLELPRDRFPDVGLVRKLVEEQGGSIVEAPAPDAAPGAAARHVLVVRLPEAARDRALAAIGDVDRRVRMRPARAAYKARLGELRASGAALTIARPGEAPVELPLAEIVSARTMAPVTIADDAIVLLEGERPRDQIAKLVVLGFLAAFALTNLLALRAPAPDRGLRS
jgi:hypothetical protein